MSFLEKEKIECSVGIIVFNRASTLETTLRSVKDFDEIIVCDGGSVDGTLELAKKYGCKIIEQDVRYKRADGSISDFSGVRNQTLEASTNDWFLFIDSDEYLSNDSVEEIRRIVKEAKPKYRVYDMPRKFVHKNNIIDCAVAYPCYQTRFFHKEAVEKFRRNVHERIVVKENYSKGTLMSPTLVPLAPFEEMLRKGDYYLSIEEKKVTTFRNWFFYIFLKTIASSLLSLAKLLKVIFFCRGRKMPLYNEFARHRYNFKLIFLTGKHFLFKK